MASYANGASVDVRHDTARTWLPGTVTNPCPLHADCWLVTLNAPVTANVWTGTTRKYGGANNLTNNEVHIAQAGDVENLTEGQLIRIQGG